VYADLLLCKELAGLLMLMSLTHYAELMDVHTTAQRVGVGITANDHLSQKIVQRNQVCMKTQNCPLEK